MKTFSKVFTCTLLLSSLLINISCKKETASTTPPAVINVVPPKVFLVPVGQLSIKRDNVAVLAAGNKIFFAGGNLETASDIIPLSSRVDIYDVITKTWSTAELSEARCDIGAVVVGNKILFASGGNNWTGGVLGYN